jgi:hypothetical protein
LDLFEFILVITSVVYALALAQILLGVGRLAQTDATIRFFLPHTLWVVILFLTVLTTWWAGWEFRSVAWVFPKYIYMLITPVFVFFSASLIIPQRTDVEEVALDRHFLKIRTLVLCSYFIALLAQFADGPVLANEPLWFPGRIVQAAILATVLIGAFTARRRLQELSSIVVFLFLVFITLTRFWNPG